MHRRISLLLIAAAIIAGACASRNSQTTPESGSTAASPAASSTSAAGGGTSQVAETVMPERVQAAFERNCKSCHGPEGSGIKGVGPDLRLAKQRSMQDWVTYLKDPKGVHSTSKIPAMAALEDADFDAIGGYLADLTQNNK